MNEPLKIKNVGRRVVWKTRVLFFDPQPIYDRIKIDKHKRTQTVFMDAAFPVRGKRCRCGCGKLLKGRRTAWASNDCSKFARAVVEIIKGNGTFIKSFLQIYHEWECIECESDDPQMDHIIGVKHGGGGCWLSNFQLLCRTCHVKKTNKDFKRKPKVKK